MLPAGRSWAGVLAAGTPGTWPFRSCTWLPCHQLLECAWLALMLRTSRWHVAKYLHALDVLLARPGWSARRLAWPFRLRGGVVEAVLGAWQLKVLHAATLHLPAVTVTVAQSAAWQPWIGAFLTGMHLQVAGL